MKNKKRLSKVADLGCILCLHLGYGPTPAQMSKRDFSDMVEIIYAFGAEKWVRFE